MKSNKKIYLKSLGSRGKIKLWLVDGVFIRENIDSDFTNFGQHFRFDYIPENEFWFDREAVPNERKFFVDHLLVEWKLMKEGLTYFFATSKADRKEMAERRKAEIVKISGKSVRGEFLKQAHKELLGTAGEFKIWLIDGRFVRSKYDIEFTEGGHGLVYDYVPENEIWIDDDVVEKERKYVLLHELHERLSMKKGFTYPVAHAKALVVEWKARHGLTKIDWWFKRMGVKLGE